MIRGKNRSVSERSRFRTLVVIALLLPASAAIAFAGSALRFQAAGAVQSTYPTRILDYTVIWIENIDEPVSNWNVSESPWPAQEDWTGVVVHFAKQTSSAKRGLLSANPVDVYTVVARLDSVRALESSLGGQPDSLEPFEREFGPDWRSLRHPDFTSEVVPAIDAIIERNLMRWFRGNRSGATATGTVGNGGSLILQVSFPTDRWRPIGRFFRGTIPLWILASVCFLAYRFINRERKARRWVAMKCPKCGYERQRDRDECPECGLVYERPSFVMWDPTEDVAEASKAERDAR